MNEAIKNNQTHPREYLMNDLMEQKNQLIKDIEFFNCYQTTQEKINELEAQLYEVEDTIKKLSQPKDFA